jgi:hypothetical protein
MARKKNKNQVMVRISMENGTPRVRQLTAKEEKEFYKAHPNVRVPTYSLGDIQRGLEQIENELGRMRPKSKSQETPIPDPSTISILGDPSAR